MPRILLVEDEEAMARGLKFNLELEGYEVVVASDGRTALDRFRDDQPPFDVIVLDLMLPEMSGYEVCRQIRNTDDAVPVIVLSARSLSEDKALAFDCGTDQYMTKPFDLRELLTRVRKLIERRPVRRGPPDPAAPARRGSPDPSVRRGSPDPADPARRGSPDPAVRAAEPKPPRPSGPRTTRTVEFGRVRVDFGKHELSVDGQRFEPTTRELSLLEYFIDHEGYVLSRAQILEDVWDESADITTRTVDNFVLRLRKMIEPDPAEPRHILSIRGAGYRFIAGADVPPDAPH